MTYALHHVSDNGKLFSRLDKAKKQRPKSCHGILRCRPKNSEAVAMRSCAHRGLMSPLEKVVRGIETSRVRVFAAANTWRTQRPRGASWFRAAASQHSEEVRPKCYQGIIRCRAGAGGQGKPSGDGKPAGPDRPLGKGVGGI